MSRSAYYLAEENERGSYDSVSANQLDEFRREGLEDWRHEMRKLLDARFPGWRADWNAITEIDEAAEVLLGESPYADY